MKGETIPMPKTFNVEDAVARLREIAASVPGYESADSKVWKRIVRKGSHPNQYIEAGADLVDASPELAVAAHFESATARDGVQLSNDIRMLISEAQSFLNGLRFTDAKLRATLVDGCDRAYALAPGVARSDPSLVIHIQAMRHASRRSGGPKKQATEPVTSR